MAAAKLQHSMSVQSGPSTGAVGGPILLETMQIVEPRKPIPVPNHLLESSMFADFCCCIQTLFLFYFYLIKVDLLYY